MTDNIFPKGDPAPIDYFTGSAWIKPLVAAHTSFNCVIGHVVFKAGARNNWHTHPGGQILIITDGEGYYQEEGKPIQILRKGDVITISADLKHWHGASIHSDMAHIAISTNTDRGVVTWLEAVTDEQYNSIAA